MLHVPSMTSKQRALLCIVAGCAGLGLGGCVAAVIPVAASGLIGGSKLRHHDRPSVVRQEQPAAAPAMPAAAVVSAAPATPGAPTATMPSVPADRSTMKVGQAYVGDLPPPTGVAAAPGSAPAPAPATATAMAMARASAPATAWASGVVATTNATPANGTDHPSTSTWSEVMHHAAAAALQRPAESALLVKGSTAAVRHWVPCGDKPMAVLVNLPAAGTPFFGGAADNLKAIETMGVALVYMSDQPATVVAQQRVMLAADGLAASVVGTTLFPARGGGTGATVRATIGERYCVVAVVGGRADDFPGAILPGVSGASVGWFLVR